MELPGKPVAEVTKLYWVILSLEKENASTNILFTKTFGHWREKNDETNEFVYGELRKQTSRESVGNCETNLIWKENCPPLRSNEVNSFGRLHNLTKSLIVYDDSANPNKYYVSSNEYLESGPPLQNSQWDIIIRLGFRPIPYGDIEKAFLQIRIRKSEGRCVKTSLRKEIWSKRYWNQYIYSSCIRPPPAISKRRI